MSFLRARSIAQIRAVRIARPVNPRFYSTPSDGAVKVSPADAPTTPPKDSSLINKEGPGEAMARHQPDYNATIDHATSYVTSSFSRGFNANGVEGLSHQFRNGSWMAVSQVKP